MVAGDVRREVEEEEDGRNEDAEAKGQEREGGRRLGEGLG